MSEESYYFLPSKFLSIVSVIVLSVATVPLLAYTISPNPNLFLGNLTSMLVGQMAEGTMLHLGTAYVGVIYWSLLSALVGAVLAYGFFWELPLWPEKIVLGLTSGFVAVGFIDGLAALVLPWLFGGTSSTFRQPSYFYVSIIVFIAIGLLGRFFVDNGGDEIW